jgi:hypothetical protein
VRLSEEAVGAGWTAGAATIAADNAAAVTITAQLNFVEPVGDDADPRRERVPGRLTVLHQLQVRPHGGVRETQRAQTQRMKRLHALFYQLRRARRRARA